MLIKLPKEETYDILCFYLHTAKLTNEQYADLVGYLDSLYWKLTEEEHGRVLKRKR